MLRSAQRGPSRRPAGGNTLRLESLEQRYLLAAAALASEASGAEATGSISGRVWVDINANQLPDAGEEGQPGITLYLDQNQNGRQDLGEPSTLTNSIGVYQFTDLAPGTYRVGEVAPPAWVQTFPATDFSAPSYVGVHKNGVGGVDGLNGAEAVAVTSDGRHLYVASILNNSVTLFQRDPFSGQLTFDRTYQDGVNGVSNLVAAHWIAISPDQNFLYVAARGSNSIVAFRRDVATGQLSPIQILVEGQGVSGLQGASVVALSPDGRHAYVAGRFDNAVVVLRRDTTTGMLTYVETEKDGLLGVDGLDDVRWVEVSPDGNFVYAVSLNDYALVSFARNEFTGRLTYLGMLKDGVDGVDGLDQAGSLAMSHDGRNLYVAGSRDDSVAVFSRDLVSGLPSFVQVLKNGVDGISGLDGAISIEIAPDDTALYVNGFFDDSLAVFSRDPATGLLTPGTVFRDGQGGVDGLDGSHGGFFHVTGRSVYTAGYSEDALTTWQLPSPWQLAVVTAGEEVSGVQFGIRNGALVNRPPRLNLIGNRTVNEGELLSLLAAATDSDAGDSITYSLAPGQPQGMFILPVLGALQWLPKDSGGPFNVTVIASDGNLVLPTDQETFQVTVRNVPPIVSFFGPDTATGGIAVSFTIGATDLSQTDTQAGFTYQFDWNGDGTIDESIVGPGGGILVDHTFQGQGLKSVVAYAVDKDGGVSAPATVTIDVAPGGLVGDANGDGEVGSVDYTIWAATFGQTGLGLAADFDGNGEVGAGDYTLWAANFGATLGGGSAPIAPPAAAVASAPSPPSPTAKFSAVFSQQASLAAAAVDRVLAAGTRNLLTATLAPIPRSVVADSTRVVAPQATSVGRLWADLARRQPALRR